MIVALYYQFHYYYPYDDERSSTYHQLLYVPRDADIRGLQKELECFTERFDDIQVVVTAIGLVETVELDVYAWP